MRQLFSLAVALLEMCLAGPALGGGTDEQAVQALIETHGLNAVLEVVIDKRYGEVTIHKGNGFSDTYGRPRKDLVSAATILRDLDKAGMTIDDLRGELDESLAADEAKRQRFARDRATPPEAEQDGRARTEVRVRYGDGNPACLARCKKDYRACQEKTLDQGDDCSKLRKGVGECLSRNQRAVIACNREQLSCEDSCYQ